MPNESLITRIENMLTEIVELGGQNEDTKIVPNLTVQDSNPAGLTGFIIVSDNRDGDNILAKKVGSVVYSDNDLVNIMFLKGGEAIAFQQGSESANNGIWEIVSGTTTDIYYDKGNVAIGKSVAPDAALEILDTSQPQLRLTHTEDVVFTEFTTEADHDLLIKTSGAGQILLQPTTDSTDFFQVLDADGGTPILNVDSTNENVAVGIDDTSFTLQGSSVRGILFVNRGTTAGRRTAIFSAVGSTQADNTFLKARAGPAAAASGDVVGNFFYSAHDGTDYNRSARIYIDINGAVSANTVPMAIKMQTSETNSAGLADRVKILANGDVIVGSGTPAAQLHVDQESTTAAQPVAYFDQADVSEEMFEFNTTIGVGNAIEAVGAKTLTTTHFIKVTLPGALTRYFPVGTIA